MGWLVCILLLKGGLAGFGAAKEAPTKKYHTPVAAPLTDRRERRTHRQVLRPSVLFRAQGLPPLFHRQGKQIKLVWLRQVFYLLVLAVLVRERVGIVLSSGYSKKAIALGCLHKRGIAFLLCRVLAIYT